MKETIVKCDMCGEELGADYNCAITRTGDSPISKPVEVRVYDLCGDCNDKVKEFINGD